MTRRGGDTGIGCLDEGWIPINGCNASLLASDPSHRRAALCERDMGRSILLDVWGAFDMKIHM